MTTCEHKSVTYYRDGSGSKCAVCGVWLNRPAAHRLGYANGWTRTPDMVEKCQHPLTSTPKGKCLTRYACGVCDFEFLVDSSD